LIQVDVIVSGVVGSRIADRLFAGGSERGCVLPLRNLPTPKRSRDAFAWRYDLHALPNNLPRYNPHGPDGRFKFSRQLFF